MSDLSALICSYQANGGEIKELPYGNSVRPDDGENWQTINQNRYKIKVDKEMKTTQSHLRESGEYQ